MLQEFTEDDRLREQYRLQHEWLRNQRYEEYAKKKMKDDLAKERKLRKQEARKREETERKSILALRKVGLSDKEIAETLDMSEDAVRRIV